MNVVDMSGRIPAYVLGFGATLVVLSPLATGAADSFPISTFPMFARAPGTPTLHAVLGVAADGREQRLPPALVASGEVLQTKVMIERSVQGGDAAMAELCRGIAERVADSEPGSGLRYIDIVRRRYDPVAYFVSGPSPLEQERLLRCPVPNRQTAPAAVLGTR
jgi:hypothetical protein